MKSLVIAENRVSDGILPECLAVQKQSAAALRVLIML